MLDLDLPKPKQQIHHRDGLLLIGSCFTENIGLMLEELKFNAVYNPGGILFDPDSVSRQLDDFVSRKSYTSTDLVEHNGLFHSWNHHGKFSNPDPHATLKSINEATDKGSEQLKNAHWCV